MLGSSLFLIYFVGLIAPLPLCLNVRNMRVDKLNQSQPARTTLTSAQKIKKGRVCTERDQLSAAAAAACKTSLIFEKLEVVKKMADSNRNVFCESRK